MAAFDRASSALPCVSLLSPSVRPGVFFQFLAGTGARGADGEVVGAPTTRPGPENPSGLLEEREQMLPIVLGQVKVGMQRDRTPRVRLGIVGCGSIERWDERVRSRLLGWMVRSV